MPGQGRLGDKANIAADAHGCPGCPHPGIGPAISGSPDVFVNGRPALRVDDMGIHAVCCGPNMWQAQQGSATVFINGKPAFRMNDPTKHCGGQGQLVEGSADVIVGDGGGGGGGGGGGSSAGGAQSSSTTGASASAGVSQSKAAAASASSHSASTGPQTSTLAGAEHPASRGPIRLPALTLVAEKRAASSTAAPDPASKSETAKDEKKECNKTALFEINDHQAGLVHAWKTNDSSAFFFKSKLSIDADGAPNAYHPRPHTERGLDLLDNAGGPGNWYGVVTDDAGEPIIQTDGLYKGFYVSPTSLADHSKKKSDPSRYVDSSAVPYISLPKHPKHQPPRHSAEPGDLAAVYYIKTKRTAYAIFAETGPARAIGEGSIQLADDLGMYKHDARRDARPGKGVDRALVIYVVFPGTRKHPAWPVPVETIRSEGARLFNEWGGLTRLRKCFPEIG